MATYSVNNPRAINAITGAGVPAQSFNVNVPDEGEVFRATGDYGTQIYMRQGKNLYNLNLLDRNIIGQGQYENAGAQAGAAKQTLSLRGLNYDSLPEYNMADLQAYGRAMGLSTAAFPITNVKNPIFPGGDPNASDALNQFIEQSQKFNQGKQQEAQAQEKKKSEQATASESVTANSTGNTTGTSQSFSQNLNTTLQSQGLPTSFSYRNKVATSAGIKNYVGTAEQNATILKKVESGDIDFSQISTSESPSVGLSSYSNPQGLSIGNTETSTPKFSIGAPVGSAPGAQGTQESFINNKSYSFFQFLEGGGSGSFRIPKSQNQ